MYDSRGERTDNNSDINDEDLFITVTMKPCVNVVMHETKKADMIDMQ